MPPARALHDHAPTAPTPTAAVPLRRAALSLRRWWAGWPMPCAVCRSWQGERVCARCLARFAPSRPRCLRCAEPTPAGVAECGRCLRRPPAFESTVAAFDHAQPWSGLVADFKFGARPGLAALFAQRVHEALHTQGLGPDLPPDLLVVPIPLSEARLRQRGYNQSWEIARRLAPMLRRPARSALLLRLFDTPHQVGSRREQRLSNVTGAFAVDPLARADLAGRPVAIVDDVMTTGATMEAAARALLQAGASSVRAWVVTRADRGTHEIPNHTNNG